MAFSSGTYTLPGAALNTGDTVSATENNTFRNDVATAFNLTWLRNGTAAATADIPMGGYSFTNCAAVGSNGSLLLKVNNGTTAATLDTSGNLGLGVTPSNAWAGTTSIETQSFNLNSVSTSDARFLQNAYYNVSTSAIYKTTNAASMYRQASGAHQWFNAASGTAGNAITWTQAMTLDASGNLGVGTTSPSGTIAAGYTSRFTSYVAGGNAAINIADPNGNWYLGTTSGNFVFYSQTATAERARINSSGNLLVGTTGLTGTTGKIQAIATSGSFAAYSSQLTNTSTATVFECTNSSGTYIGGITCSNTATSFPTSSDYRLKEITGAVTGEEAKNFIMALQPKRGLWKVDGSPFVGFLAHEFQEVSPTSVNGGKDAVNDDGVPVYQSLESSSPEVMANLVALLQEQQAIITQLQADVAALKGQA
jgi:hypothetical protein